MYRKVVPILLVIVWVGIIFFFSLQEGNISQSNSGFVVNFIYKYLSKIIGDLNKGILHYYVRKGAHITIYFILCLTIMNALYYGGFRGKGLFLRAFIICLFYASMDELLQSFVKGRSGRATDVIIDSIGIIMGLILGRIVIKKNRDKRLETRD